MGLVLGIGLEDSGCLDVLDAIFDEIWVLVGNDDCIESSVLVVRTNSDDE